MGVVNYSFNEFKCVFAQILRRILLYMYKRLTFISEFCLDFCELNTHFVQFTVNDCLGLMKRNAVSTLDIIQVLVPG
jgi:hypothetical protein